MFAGVHTSVHKSMVVPENNLSLLSNFSAANTVCQLGTVFIPKYTLDTAPNLRVSRAAPGECMNRGGGGGIIYASTLYAVHLIIDCECPEWDSPDFVLLWPHFAERLVCTQCSARMFHFFIPILSQFAILPTSPIPRLIPRLIPRRLQLPGCIVPTFPLSSCGSELLVRPFHNLCALLFGRSSCKHIVGFTAESARAHTGLIGSFCSKGSALCALAVRTVRFSAWQLSFSFIGLAGRLYNAVALAVQSEEFNSQTVGSWKRAHYTLSSTLHWDRCVTESAV